jgi:hypothetical protein
MMQHLASVAGDGSTPLLLGKKLLYLLILGEIFTITLRKGGEG